MMDTRQILYTYLQFMYKLYIYAYIYISIHKNTLEIPIYLLYIYSIYLQQLVIRVPWDAYTGVG